MKKKTNVNVSKEELKRVLTKVVGTQFVTIVFRKNKVVHQINGQVYWTSGVFCTFKRVSNGEFIWFNMDKLLVVKTRKFILRREQ